MLKVNEEILKIANSINEENIKVENPGILEVPEGKKVDELPQSHFEKLINKKGYAPIIKALTNLETWNKNKNPKLSKWASNMADKLKKKFKKESFSIQNKDWSKAKYIGTDGKKKTEGLKEKMQIKFVGVDEWNRPVFKPLNKNYYLTDTNNLFDYDATEKEIKQFYSDLTPLNNYIVYKGKSFNSEPMGNELDYDLEIVTTNKYESLKKNEAKTIDDISTREIGTYLKSIKSKLPGSLEKYIPTIQTELQLKFKLDKEPTKQEILDILNNMPKEYLEESKESVEYLSDFKENLNKLKNAIDKVYKKVEICCANWDTEKCKIFFDRLNEIVEVPTTNLLNTIDRITPKPSIKESKSTNEEFNFIGTFRVDYNWIEADKTYIQVSEENGRYIAEGELANSSIIAEANSLDALKDAIKDEMISLEYNIENISYQENR